MDVVFDEIQKFQSGEMTTEEFFGQEPVLDDDVFLLMNTFFPKHTESAKNS